MFCDLVEIVLCPSLCPKSHKVQIVLGSQTILWYIHVVSKVITLLRWENQEDTQRYPLSRKNPQHFYIYELVCSINYIKKTNTKQKNLQKTGL